MRDDNGDNDAESFFEDEDNEGYLQVVDKTRNEDEGYLNVVENADKTRDEDQGYLRVTDNADYDSNSDGYVSLGRTPHPDDASPMKDSDVDRAERERIAVIELEIARLRDKLAGNSAESDEVCVRSLCLRYSLL